MYQREKLSHHHQAILLLVASIAFVSIPALACTNLLVTPGASENGDVMIAYNADSGNLMGSLYHYPARKSNSSPPPARKVWNWDTAAYLGEIPDAEQTYNVVGNTNEHGLVIAETTFGGISILSDQPGAKIDYGSLIYITLQRSESAKEAIHNMHHLMDTYGYASEGESFSIADRSGDVWIMEVIGRGKGKVGAVFVALRIPDGYVAAHSNQARIQTFPRDDPENCVYSADVVELAKDIGVYTSPEDDPNDLNFSFSDVYDPVLFMGARASDARTWAIFSALTADASFQKTYEAYAMGKDPNNRMPLWIMPKALMKMTDVMDVMSNHYEGTAMEFGQDVGAGLFGTPYRPRPLVWQYKGESYHNERAVATQQTGWNFIAQIRLDKPPPISSVLWFGVDDSSTAPRFPVYGGSTDVSQAYAGKGTQDGVPSSLLAFDLGKAFWVQNMVSNLAYSRWTAAYPLLREKLRTVYNRFQKEIDLFDEQLCSLFENGADNEALVMATAFTVGAGDRLHKEWMEFYGNLFARFRDFYVIEEDLSDPICNCKVREEGLTDDWKGRIVKETGAHYKCEDDDSVPDLSGVNQLRGGLGRPSLKFQFV